MTLHRTSILTVFLGLCLGFASLAHAQWGWTDASGRRIFSDQGPSSDVPEKNIFKRPFAAKGKSVGAQLDALAQNGPASANGAAASAAKPGVSAPKISGKDTELEKKKKEAEAAEAAKKKAADDKFAQDKAENCERAKKAKAGFDSGVRMATTNAKGEREIMSDTDRAAERKRIDGVIASDCK
jgi:hypothetical protein